MPFNTALTSGNYDTLRGTASVQSTYQTSVYLSLCPNTIKFAARVNQVSFAASYAQITFDTVTVGAYTDIKADMTILIGSTANAIDAEFVGRIRADNSGVVSTATTININETSADIADNWYIFVIDDYRLWDKLARDVSGTQYKDYQLTFRQLLPMVYNLRSGYAGWVSGSVLTIAFAPLAIAATSGASISTWAWDVGDGTITVGSSSTQNITATFPAGFRWVKLTVTDSGSRAIVRHIPVFAHDASTYPPQLLSGEQFQVQANVAGGFDATVTAFAQVSGVYDNTLVVAWREDVYQDSSSAISGSNIALVGRFRKSTDVSKADDTYALVSDTRYTIEGVLTQLARIEQLPYEFLNKASPTVWNQIKNLTLWRAIWFLLSEHSTFGQLHSLQFDSTTDTYLVNGLRTQGGNILAAVNDLAVSVNAAMQASAAGRCEVVTDARMLSTSARNALTTVANWTDSDLLDLSFDHEQVKSVGRVKATGGAYNSASDNFNTFESLAPGVAQDYPEATADLERQVLTANASSADAQTELNTRSGNELARRQIPDTLTVTHLDGYNWLTPAVDQWYTFTLDGTETTRGIILTTTIRWLLTSVSVSYDSTTGTSETQATYVRETIGTPGQTVTYPPITSTPLTIPTFPPFDIFPAFPIDPSLYLGTDPTGTQIPPYIGTSNLNTAFIPKNGNALGIATASQLWLTQTFLKSSTPNWVEVTPELAVGESIVAIIFSGFEDEMYILTNLSNTSYVYWRPHAYDLTTPWAQSGAISGAFSVIRPASTQNDVYIYCPSSSGAGSLVYSDDMTSALGALSHEIGVLYPFAIWNGSTASRDGTSAGAYSASGGRGGGGCIQGSDNGFGHIQAAVAVDLGSAQTVTGASFFHREDVLDSCTTAILFFDASKALITEVDYINDATLTYNQHIWTGTQAGVRYVVFESDVGSGNISYVDDITVTYGAASGDALVAYSSDNGATFTPQSIGTSPGSIGGFDVERIGNPSLAAVSGQTDIATTLGGVYSAYGSTVPTGSKPSALLIPRYKPGTTGTNNAATNTPEFVLGSTDLTAGNAALWRVSASGATFDDITPHISSDYGKTVSPNDMAIPWFSGKIMAAIKLFNTTRKLVTTNDLSGTPTWTSRASLSALADCVQFRKGDTTMNQLFFIDGTVGVKYSPDRGVTLVTKAYPSTDPLVSLSVYG